MNLSSTQRRQWPLLTHGSVKDVLNTRPDIFDAYHALPQPRVVANTARRIIGLDRRGDVENLISLDPETGYLYLEGTIDANDHYTELQEMISGSPGNVESGAACGDFLILRRTDSSLFYLRWEQETRTYFALGTLPDSLPFTVEKVDQAPALYSIEAARWTRPVEDLRAGVPEEASRQVSALVKRSWAAALDSCRSMDMLVQPVTVRVLVRMFDGLPYSISEPIRISGAGWTGYDRFLLTPEMDSDGNAIGTRSAGFSVSPYRIAVSVQAPEHSLWNEVFSHVEIYVEPEQDVTSGGECSVAYNTTGRQLSVFLPLRTSTELESGLGAGPWRLARSLRMPDAGRVEFGSCMGVEAVELQTLAPPGGRADALISHGAFLHMAHGDTLVTSESGNPLSVKSSTRLGSRILTMAALPSGGGAYTRQYLYVCTESAIFALAYDNLGRHTNCRPVSPQRVTSRNMLVSTDECVYALSESGNLICLLNANPQTLYRGLPRFEALMWDGSSNELWLLHGRECDVQGSSLVLQLGSGGGAYRRDVSMDAPVWQSGRILYSRDGALMQARPHVRYGASPDTFAPAMVRTELGSSAGGLMQLKGAVSAPSRLSLRLRVADEYMALTSAEVFVDTESCSPLGGASGEWLLSGRRQYAFPLVCRGSGRGKIGDRTYEVTMEGQWTCAETPSLMTLIGSATGDGRFVRTSRGGKADRRDAPSPAQRRRRYRL